MSRVAQIIWQTVGVVLLAGMLVAAVVWGYTMRPSGEPCGALTYRILDADKRMYLSENELDSLLRKDDVYPVGKRVDRVDLARIEAVIRRHPMVERAECYMTPLFEVRVDLRQRVPLLLVKTPIERYYIDTHHRVLPWREQIKDEVLVVSGAVGPQAACNGLAEMAEWLQNEPYWRERIHHIHMRTPLMAVAFVQQGEGAKEIEVVLGPLNDYERKMNKLRVFMENGAEAIQGKQYRELDVRYRGQVIGRQ